MYCLIFNHCFSVTFRLAGEMNAPGALAKKLRVKNSKQGGRAQSARGNDSGISVVSISNSNSKSEEDSKNSGSEFDAIPFTSGPVRFVKIFMPLCGIV